MIRQIYYFDCEIYFKDGVRIGLYGQKEIISRTIGIHKEK